MTQATVKFEIGSTYDKFYTATKRTEKFVTFTMKTGATIRRKVFIGWHGVEYVRLDERNEVYAATVSEVVKAEASENEPEPVDDEVYSDCAGDNSNPEQDIPADHEPEAQVQGVKTVVRPETPVDLTFETIREIFESYTIRQLLIIAEKNYPEVRIYSKKKKHIVDSLARAAYDIYVTKRAEAELSAQNVVYFVKGKRYNSYTPEGKKQQVSFYVRKRFDDGHICIEETLGNTHVCEVRVVDGVEQIKFNRMTSGIPLIIKVTLLFADKPYTTPKEDQEQAERESAAAKSAVQDEPEVMDDECYSDILGDNSHPEGDIPADHEPDIQEASPAPAIPARFYDAELEAIATGKKKFNDTTGNWTITQAYERNTRAENMKLDFDNVIWDTDIEAIVKFMREHGQKEFTISTQQGSLIRLFPSFEELGFKLVGITTVNSQYVCDVDNRTGEKKKIPAFLLRDTQEGIIAPVSSADAETPVAEAWIDDDVYSDILGDNSHPEQDIPAAIEPEYSPATTKKEATLDEKFRELIGLEDVEAIINVVLNLSMKEQRKIVRKLGVIERAEDLTMAIFSELAVRLHVKNLEAIITAGDRERLIDGLKNWASIDAIRRVCANHGVEPCEDIYFPAQRAELHKELLKPASEELPPLKVLKVVLPRGSKVA